MTEKTETSFERLAAINVNAHVEKKNGLTYLSWAWAVDQLLRADPAANWEFHEPIRFGETMMVVCTVTAFGKPITMHLPVMDHLNKAIKNPDAFAVNKNMMRALVKAIACHGLGLYIYAGEDLPAEDENKEAIKKGNGTITPKDGALDSLNEEEREYIEGIANELKSQLATNPIQAARTYLNTKLVDMEHVALKALLNSRENNTLVHLSKILDSKNMEELRERFSSAPVYIKDMAVQVKDKMKADFEANGKEAV